MYCCSIGHCERSATFDEDWLHRIRLLEGVVERAHSPFHWKPPGTAARLFLALDSAPALSDERDAEGETMPADLACDALTFT